MEPLRNLGLTKYESAVYSDLIKNGKSEAKDISRRSKIPPTAVYPFLKSLIEKELIQQVKGEISLFEAPPPESALKVFIKGKHDLLEQ